MLQLSLTHQPPEPRTCSQRGFRSVSTHLPFSSRREEKVTKTGLQQETTPHGAGRPRDIRSEERRPALVHQGLVHGP